MKILLLNFLLVFYASAFNVEIESFAPDPKYAKVGFINFGTLRTTRLAKNNYTITGHFELKKTLGVEKTLNLQIKSLQSNVVYIDDNRNFCEFIKSDKMFIDDLLKVSNLPQDKQCPIGKGNYTIDNYLVHPSKLSFLPLGRYKIRTSFLEDDIILTAYELVISVTPK